MVGASRAARSGVEGAGPTTLALERRPPRKDRHHPGESCIQADEPSGLRRARREASGRRLMARSGCPDDRVPTMSRETCMREKMCNIYRGSVARSRG